MIVSSTSIKTSQLSTNAAVSFDGVDVKEDKKETPVSIQLRGVSAAEEKGNINIIERNDDYCIYFDNSQSLYHYILFNPPMQRTYNADGLLQSEILDNGLQRYYEKIVERFDTDEYGNQRIANRLLLSRERLPDLSWKDYDLERKIYLKSPEGKNIAREIALILSSDLKHRKGGNSRICTNSRGDLVEYKRDGGLRVIFHDGDMVDLDEGCQEIELALPHYLIHYN